MKNTSMNPKKKMVDPNDLVRLKSSLFGGLLFLLILTPSLTYGQSDGDMRTMKHGGGYGSSGTFEVYSASTDTWVSGVTRVAWVPNTAYTVGTLCSNGGNLYSVVLAGTSAATSGPSGTTSSIVDGTVTWMYVTTAAIFPTTSTNLTIMDGVGQTSNVSGGVAGTLTVGQGNAFSGTANLTGTGITSITINNAGALIANPGVMFIGAGTTLAAAYPTYKLVGAYYKTKGAGYTTPPTVTFAGTTAWAANTALVTTTAPVQRSNGGRLYNLATSGTTALSGGPTGTGTGIVEGIPWQANTVYAVGNQCVNGGNLYTVASIANTNTSAASGGPTGTTAGIVDNDVTWNYVAAAAVWNYVNEVPTCHAVVSGGKVTSIVVDNAGGGYYIAGASFSNLTIAAPYASWVTLTAYLVGDIRIANSRAYICTTAGTSGAAATAPTGIGTGLVDGTVTWDYYGEAATASYGIQVGVDNIVITGAGSYTVAPAVVMGSSWQCGNSGTSRNIAISGDLTLKLGANMVAGTGSSSLNPVLSVGGNLTAEGPVNFITAVPTSTSSTTISFTKTGAATLSGAGVCTFKGLTVGATTNLTINSTGNLIGTAAVNGSLTTTAGGSLTLAAGKALTVNGTIANAGTINLNNSASALSTLIVSGAISGAGTFNVQQYLTGAGGATPTGRYWYVSSPLTTATSAPYALTEAATPLNVLWSFSEAAYGYTRVASATPVTLTPGAGFVALLGDNKTVTLAGASINNGAVTITATRAADTGLNPKRGYNLVGNPYSAYLNINTAFAAATGLESSIWYRSFNSTSSTMVFDTYNATTGAGISLGSDFPALTNFIPPMQAFWVHASADGISGSLPLTAAMRSHQPTGNLMRSAAVDAQMLRLQVSNGSVSDQALIGFYPEASDLFDTYDSHKMSNDDITIPEIYTYAGAEQVAINGLAPLTGNKELALGFKTGKSGQFTIKALEMTNLDADSKVILKDKVLNKVQNLTENPEYTFTSDAATTDDRFIISIEKVATKLTPVKESSFEVLANGNNQLEVTLNNLGGKQAQISLYNALGQQLMSTTSTSTTTLLNKTLNHGVYVVKVNVGGIQTSQKVVINQ